MSSNQEIIQELYTVRDYIRYGVSIFNAANIYFGHGFASALDEAYFLVLHALHLPHTTDNNFLDARLTQKERYTVLELFESRVQTRKPAAYLVKEAWFAGLPFFVDARVLIPRSPIAELIEKRFEPWIDYDKVEGILDIGTGSGCIAIACAYAFPEAQVDAADISADALEVAKINVAKHNVAEQVNLIKSDVFSALKNKKYDIIISNPPYVDAQDMADLPKEYLHEPKLALAAGATGLDIVATILHEAENHLNEEGILIVEVGNSAHELVERFPNLPFMWLTFERGESEVFLLTKEQLAAAK